MAWTELLQHEIADTYKAAHGLIDMVDEGALDWKPRTGENWMTTGQLLRHITEACGECCRGFVTGEWPVPEGAGDEGPDPTMVTAEQMATVASVAEARERLAKDKALALAVIAEAGEERLANEASPAPWDPSEMALGHRLLQMVGHLGQHRTQLFYYLKLQGKPVNTWHLYGL